LAERAIGRPRDEVSVDGAKRTDLGALAAGGACLFVHVAFGELEEVKNGEDRARRTNMAAPEARAENAQGENRRKHRRRQIERPIDGSELAPVFHQSELEATGREEKPAREHGNGRNEP